MLASALAAALFAASLALLLLKPRHIPDWAAALGGGLLMVLLRVLPPDAALQAQDLRGAGSFERVGEPGRGDLCWTTRPAPCFCFAISRCKVELGGGGRLTIAGAI